MPHLNANDQYRNGFLQYESRDGGQNISEASEFKQRLPYECVNNNKDPRMHELYPSGSIDGEKNVSETSEFEFDQNTHEITNKAELAQYHLQSLFSPQITSIEKAIYNGQLSSFPGLEKALIKHLPMSSATIKGHMHKQRKGF